MEPAEFYGRFCGNQVPFCDKQCIDAEKRSLRAPAILTFRDVAGILRSLNETFAKFGLGAEWSLLKRMEGGFQFKSSLSGRSTKYIKFRPYGGLDSIVKWPWLDAETSRSIVECDLVDNAFTNKLFYDFTSRTKFYYSFDSMIAMDDVGSFSGWSDLEKSVANLVIRNIVDPQEEITEKAGPIDPTNVSAEIRAERISAFKSLVRVVTQSMPQDWGRFPAYTNPYQKWWANGWTQMASLTIADVQSVSIRTRFVNRTISLQAISHPIFFKTKLYVLAKDRHGDISRAEVSPLPPILHNNLLAVFGPGTNFLLLNPEVMIDETGEKYLAVENLNDLDAGSASGEYQPICYVCEKSSPDFQCSVCKVARYCSKECQKLDWNTQRHKELCPIMIKQLNRG